MANERLGQQVEVTFHIQEGSFYNCIMPGQHTATHAGDASASKSITCPSENVESLWGPIPLPRLPPGVDNTCRAVTHG